MRIYSAEKEAGINLSDNTSATLTAELRICDIDKYFDGMSIADLMKETSTIQTIEELLGVEQPDLALVVAILVSTGWNLNDDVFVPAELWKSRNTPLHKPMNDNHDPAKILGHIVKSRPLDKSGNEITLSEGANPPDEFDIEVAGVLYRAFPELAARINEIITKAKTGEMFVSMEAWFTDFAYAILDSSGNSTKIIQRNEATAFLTKHLRIYGGSGQYQGYKIGRVLKDIIFGGQGFVDTPANPESVIKVAANKAVAFESIELDEITKGGAEGMEKQLQELQAKLDEAMATIAAKEKEVAELKKVVEDTAAKKLDEQVANLATEVATLTATLKETVAKLESTEAEKAKLQTEFAQVKECADKKEAELADIRKTQKATERLAKLAAVKSIADEKITLAELREMTDEVFEVVLKYAGEIKTASVVVDGTEEAKATLDTAKVVEDADFNVTVDADKSVGDVWMSTAMALCGRKEENGGGE